jgi:phosphatidylglycerophosphate synthase
MAEADHTPRRSTAILPDLITHTGLMLGVLGVSWLPAKYALILIVASLIFDALDGWAARKLHATSKYGEGLDWSVDVAIAHAIVWRIAALADSMMFAPMVSAVLAKLQAEGAYGATTSTPWRRRQRVSGRAFVTIGAVLYVLVRS